IDPSTIQKKLDANKDPEQRVDIVTILFSDTARKTALLAINGVRGERAYGRVYPGGEALGELVGYIGPITAEELSKNQGQGYGSNSKIGKTGLEKVYESRLKGADGVTMYISKQINGKETDKTILGKTESKNGEDITLAIDMDLQQKIYENMENDSGACAVVDPKNCEVLALVSSPSYDSNMFVTYRTKDQQASAAINDALNLNRFSKLYAPGSTFKLVTGAIGLNLGKINPEEAMSDVKGTEWQGSGVRVTRVDDTSEPINLRSAYVYSDNIYFARAALKIGKDDFIKGCGNFGIGEALPFDFPVVKSQVANNGINSNQALADSGYGQGEVILSPLHTALIYSTLVNNGNIMTPLVEKVSDKVTSKVWKQGAVAAQNIKILQDDLTAAIEDQNGTGHKAQIAGVKIAGKTGTAELKKSSTDDAEENGWFTAMNTENPKIVVSMVIDNVKKRGGSHYVVPLVKNVLEYFLKK
ncbi:MAG: penicillin-binding protein 2, partial [Bacillota bacterium]|nr:penicillin-binding protein 2 [Bacillota bacterium]